MFDNLNIIPCGGIASNKYAYMTYNKQLFQYTKLSYTHCPAYILNNIFTINSSTNH